MKPLQTRRSTFGNISLCPPKKPYLEKAYPATKAHVKCFKPPPSTYQWVDTTGSSFGKGSVEERRGGHL